MLERRKFQRIDVKLPVVLRCNGKLVPATALNISCGGMCLKVATHGITADTCTEVIFDLSEDVTDISVRGRIVRIEGGRKRQVGIEFNNLYSMGYNLLEKYIHKHTN